VASWILGRIEDALDARHLTARAGRFRRIADGTTYATARFTGRMLGGRHGGEIGAVRVLVMVPQDEGGAVIVQVRWTRDAYGFWFERELRLPPVVGGEAEDVDLVGVDMVITAVRWTAEGAVPLRSMKRTFHTVRKGRD